MNKAVFKKIFEVQFLLDYLLRSIDDTSFFELNQLEKTALLNTKISHGIYELSTFLNIQPLEDTETTLESNKLLFFKSATGFFIGGEVAPETVAAEQVYKPISEFAPDLTLAFSLTPKVDHFRAMNNLRLETELPAIYYFSNKGKSVFDEAVIPPYKSLPVCEPPLAHQNGFNYEMGSIAEFGGVIKQALQYTDGNDLTLWEDITDRRGITDADKVLLPHIFQYNLPRQEAVTDFKLDLVDSGNNTVKSITKTSAEPLERVNVNFLKLDENDPDSPFIPSDFYTLKIQKNGGPELNKRIYLNDKLYNKDYFGVVEVRLDEIDSPFSLLDANGFIKTRIDAGNQQLFHPVFEVRFQNRKTYWRYNKEGDFTNDEKNATATHLVHQPGQLTSIKPKGLTQTLVPFFNGISLVLPPPKVSAIKVEKPKIFSEIFINQSNRLLSS